VLGLKAEMGLIITLLPLIIQDPSMVCIFSLNQPFINPLLYHSNTPVLQILSEALLKLFGLLMKFISSQNCHKKKERPQSSPF